MQGNAGQANTRAGKMKRFLSGVRRWLGIELAPVGHIERLVSLVGGGIAIYCLITLERLTLGETGAALLVASMGASAVLLFAVPHGALSQPWAVLVGHLVSAIVGVTCARYVTDLSLAAALAVGVSIGAMHYLRAIHPPGGATALTAVVAGPEVHALGYKFVVMPVLVNATLLVTLAIAINAAFSWRRYPAALGKPAVSGSARSEDLSHADFISALRRMGTFIDIDEDDFRRLEALTHEAANTRSVDAEHIRNGAYYSNHGIGEDWSVRQVTDSIPGPDGGTITWKSVAGKDRGLTGAETRPEFARWAAFEVQSFNNVWVKIAHTGES